MSDFEDTNLFAQQEANRRKSRWIVALFVLFFAWLGFGADLILWLGSRRGVNPVHWQPDFPFLGIVYRVDRLVLFGSFVKGAERPNDVDVACKLVPRWSGDVQVDAEQHRRDLYTGRFRNTVHCMYWTQFEVLRFLKSRSRGLSMHALDDWVLKQDKHKVIFRDGHRE